jgi:glycosyltransferase involved in cell wall biosynthesis
VKIALLTEIPAPFRIPLFNALAARNDVDLRVLFLAREDPRRRHYRVYESEFAFDWRVLPGRELRRGGRWLVVNRGVGRELRRFDPDAVVVGGWNQPAFWAARSWARRRRRPLVTWVESTTEDARPGGGLLEGAKRAFVRSTTAFLVPGRASADYVRSLGVGDERIVVGPNAVDASLFAQGRVDRSGRSGCTFLYVGRLDREKGLDVLFRALDGVPAELVVVGQGDDEGRLRSLAPDRVRFTGPLERDALPAVYAEADAFVLPSLSEPWGMVLLEAAAAGLPLVATEAAGAAWEAIEDGENGVRVPAGDVTALADALRRLAADPALRQRMGARSAEIVQRFTPEAWAAATAEAARRGRSGR